MIKCKANILIEDTREATFRREYAKTKKTVPIVVFYKVEENIVGPE